jgi:hypothetical protein
MDAIGALGGASVQFWVEGWVGGFSLCAPLSDGQVPSAVVLVSCRPIQQCVCTTGDVRSILRSGRRYCPLQLAPLGEAPRGGLV